MVQNGENATCQFKHSPQSPVPYRQSKKDHILKSHYQRNDSTPYSKIECGIRLLNADLTPKSSLLTLANSVALR